MLVLISVCLVDFVQNFQFPQSVYDIEVSPPMGIVNNVSYYETDYDEDDLDYDTDVCEADTEVFEGEND